MQRILLCVALLGGTATACTSDAGTGGMTDARTDGGSDNSLATIPNPALVVAVGGEGVVSVVDPASLRVVDTVPVEAGMHPHHLGLSPDHSRVIITAPSADLSMGHGGGHTGSAHGSGATTMVYLLDVKARTLRDVIDVDATVHNAAFTPDGATIVLSMMEHGMVVGYDSKTFKEAFNVTGFEMPLEVTPTASNALLVAESGGGKVSVVDLGTREIGMRFDVGATPVAAWASGGDDYFVSVEEDMKVRHLVAKSTGVNLDSHVIDPMGMPGQAILSPDRKELWLAVEDRGVVLVFDGSTHAQLAEISAGTSPHGVAFDPSGTRVFVTDQGSTQLLVIDTKSRSISDRVEVGSKPNGIVWLERGP